MKTLLIYDCSEASFVGLTWKVGAFLARPFFDHVIKAGSWDDAERQVANLSEKYGHVQFWGHGSPGFIYIGGDPAPTSFWFSLGKAVAKDGSIWLRVCSFAASSIGKTIMTQLSKTLGCTIYAHTYIIGTWGVQSGLRKTSPGLPADWPSTEGIDEKKGAPKLLSSAPWLPNTVLAIKMSPPDL